MAAPDVQILDPTLGAQTGQRLELMAPDAALLSGSETSSRLKARFRVAVAASAVGDAERADREPCRAGGEGRAIVGAKHERPRQDPLLVDGTLDHRGRLGGAAAQLERPADNLAGAPVDDRVRVAQACSATQTLGTSRCHSWPGRST